MAHFKDKLQVFFLGLLLGLLLGGGFFLFKLDQYVKELSIYKSLTQHKEQSSETSDVKGDKQGPVSTVHSYGQSNPGPNPKLQVQRDSMPVSELTSSKKQGNDSLRKSDSTFQSTANTENIVIRKDELLTAHTVEVLNINPVASNSVTQKDSIAAKMAGVREERSSGRQFSSVEFWSSPLNFKGYKMSHNKVVLYGISEPENMKLYKLDDEVYLLCGTAVFHLEYSNDFHAYERVTSDGILSKLK